MTKVYEFGCQFAPCQADAAHVEHQLTLAARVIAIRLTELTLASPGSVSGDRQPACGIRFSGFAGVDCGAQRANR